MANSKYEYVKDFELDDTLLPNCWIVVRIDGKGFTRFSELHKFEKPNDKRALDLMDACAKEVLNEFPDVRIAFGESDEYSFVLHKSAKLYGRRSSKIVSILVSCFSANYVRQWSNFFGDQPLSSTPMFDGRAILYPDVKTLRDYLTWRQVDTHINNQYNTCFWALVQQAGLSNAEAQATLKGTDTGAKNELLFSRFGINYTHLPEQFKKGSVVIRRHQEFVAKQQEDGTAVIRTRRVPVVMYCDITKEQPFWSENSDLLA